MVKVKTKLEKLSLGKIPYLKRGKTLISSPSFLRWAFISKAIPAKNLKINSVFNDLLVK